MKKEACLSVIEDVKTNRVVMIKHHRGINKGFLNFPGGKKEANESMLDCVIRESMEETGLKPLNPVEVGYVEFPSKEFYVTIFYSTEFEGKLADNGAEVDVFWQDKNQIPYNKMRAADADFVPLVMAGKPVRRQYFYDAHFALEKIVDLVKERE